MIRIITLAALALWSSPVNSQVVPSPACAGETLQIKQAKDIRDDNLIYESGLTPHGQIIEIYKTQNHPQGNNTLSIVFYDKNGCINDVVYRDLTGAFYFLEEGLKSD